MKLLSLIVKSMRMANIVDQNRVRICRDEEYRSAVINELFGEEKPEQATHVENRSDAPSVQFGRSLKVS